jgi:hypothetical protein
MTETRDYFILYVDVDQRGSIIINPSGDYFEFSEGEENLESDIIRAVNQIVSKYYDEEPDQADFDEIASDLIILEVCTDKEKFVKDTIKKHFSKKKDDEYKEYLRLKKKFGK